MGRSVSPVNLIVTCGLLVALIAVGIGSVATTTALAQSADVSNETAKLNVTIHEDPRAVDGQGDLQRVGGWLSGRLIEQLRKSSVHLSQERYEMADDILGEEYQQRLGQYADVAGDTGESVPEQATQDFEQAQQHQRKLINTSEAVEETRENYQNARDRNDTAAARRHARELIRLAREASEQETEVNQALRSLENRTGADTTDVSQRLEYVTRETRREAARVQNATFSRTRLRVETNRSLASFTSPAPIRGRLRLGNGSRVENRRIRLQIGRTTYTTTTSAEGRFVVRYRPVLIPANATTVPVRYIPRTTAPYTEAQDQVSLTIQQVEPSLQLTATPDRPRYGNEVAVESALLVNETGVPNVPLVTTLAGLPVDQVRTDDTGRVRVNVTPGASVPPGQASLRTGVAVRNRAIAPVNATTTLTIRETPTTLSVDAAPEDGSIIVTGRLAPGTDRTDQIPPQNIVITIGETTRTVRTDSMGRYRTAIPRSAVSGESGGDTSRIFAEFDGEGTNLESATAEASVTLPASGGATGDDSGFGIRIGALALGMLSVLTLPYVLLRWRGDLDAYLDRLSDRMGNTRVGRIVSEVLAMIPLVYVLRQWSENVDAYIDDLSDRMSNTRLGQIVSEVPARIRAWRQSESEEPVTPAPERTDQSPSPEPEQAMTTENSWLGEARSAYARGKTESAVIIAYRGVRGVLTDQFDIPESHTARELLGVCERHLDSETYTSLETLTELHERTVFGSAAIGETSQQAIDVAQSIRDTVRHHPSESGDD